MKKKKEIKFKKVYYFAKYGVVAENEKKAKSKKKRKLNKLILKENE